MGFLGALRCARRLKRTPGPAAPGNCRSHPAALIAQITDATPERTENSRAHELAPLPPCGNTEYIVRSLDMQRNGEARDGETYRTLTSPWRRGWDSNPRYGCPYTAFRVRRIRPLCHLSALSGALAGLRPRSKRARRLAERLQLAKPLFERIRGIDPARPL